jgi:tripartite-type tricarboxylate transporter receptor subunit TctC
VQKRHFLAAVSLLSLNSGNLCAQSVPSYPTKPIRILVGYSAGGAVDLVARAIAQHLQAALGQPVAVENKPGAGSNIATRMLIDSPADGYTLMMAANAVSANVSLFQPAPFNIEQDIAAVALVGRVPVVIATGAASEFDTLLKVIDAARKKPLGLTYGSPGNGATPHLAMELFERAAGITHASHYRCDRWANFPGRRQRARSATACKKRQASRSCCHEPNPNAVNARCTHNCRIRLCGF